MDRSTTLWGQLPVVESTTQVTRSMLDMLTPKPYLLDKAPTQLQLKPKSATQSDIPECAYTMHSIQLLEYIKEMEKIIEHIQTTNSRDIIIPKMPEFKEPSEELKKTKVKHKAGAHKRNFEEKQHSTNFSTIESLTKQGIARIALLHDFDASTTSALDYLKDLTLSVIQNMAKSLRMTLDNEALTGSTGFYDSIDQMLHDNDMGCIKNLVDYYKTSVISYHQKLMLQCEKLAGKLEKALKSGSKPGSQTKLLTIAKPEAVQGGWVPVQPASSGHSVSAVIGPNNWKPFVKTEPHSQSQSSWTTGPAQTEALHVPESNASTFRPISPIRQEVNSYRPQKKKMRK